MFGDLICKLGTFMTMINFYGSTIFLMAISVDRFLAIVYPLKVSHHSKSFDGPLMGFLWAFNGLLMGLMGSERGHNWIKWVS